MLVALALATVLVLWLAAGKLGASTEPVVKVRSGDEVVLRRSVDDLRATSSAGVRDWLRAIPATRRVRRGNATVVFRTDYRRTAAAVKAVTARGGGDTNVAERPEWSTSSLPVVKQKLRNNCETAALSMMLAAAGRPTDQLRLQSELPTSGPLDPEPSVDGGPPRWGDPREGFVGRPKGDGGSGGFGVYENPIIGLARRHRLSLTHVGTESAEPIYQAVRSGRPVFAWVGLSDGPYDTWITPSGEQFTGNFGEHTVVLTGIRGDRLQVNDPLSGRRLTWTRAEFEQMWARLGKQALTT